MLKKIWIILFLEFCLLPLNPVFAADMRVPELRTSSFQTNLRQAISKTFNLEMIAAETYMKKAIALEPDNPTGYAFMAMLHLFAYEMCFTLEQREKEKEAIHFYAEGALNRGEKKIAQHPKDSQVLLSMALAKITKVNWAIKEKRYLEMVQETSNIWNYLETAKAADPYNYDIDFLMGLLHYHTDHLVGMTRFLSSLLITSGNRQKGLQELQTAAQKGYLLREIAQSELSSDYLNYEKQPSQALPLLLDLKKRFPNNYNFSFTLCMVLVELQRFDEAAMLAAEIEKNISSGQAPYVGQLQPRYNFLMGRLFFKRGDYEKAETSFQKAVQDKSFYNARTRSRSLVFMGMIHDIRLERKHAEDYYQRALDVEGADGIAKIDAKGYLKTPYKVDGK
jgi:tetratricopeptide (TPR) repeat protein